MLSSQPWHPLLDHVHKANQDFRINPFRQVAGAQVPDRQPSARSSIVRCLGSASAANSGRSPQRLGALSLTASESFSLCR